MDSAPETTPGPGGTGRDRRRPLVVGGLLLVVGLGLLACYVAWGRTTVDDKSLRTFLVAVGFVFTKSMGVVFTIVGVGLLGFEWHYRRGERRRGES
jgi:hypothetical protein